MVLGPTIDDVSATILVSQLAVGTGHGQHIAVPGHFGTLNLAGSQPLHKNVHI